MRGLCPASAVRMSNPVSPADPRFVGPLVPEAALAKEVDEGRKKEVRTWVVKLKGAEDREKNWEKKCDETKRVIDSYSTKIAFLESELLKYRSQLKVETGRLEEQKSKVFSEKQLKKECNEWLDDMHRVRRYHLKEHDLAPPSPLKRRRLPRPAIP